MFKKNISKLSENIKKLLAQFSLLWPASYSQRLLLFDGLDGAFRTVRLRPRSKDCCVCGDKPTITQLIDYEQFCGAKAADKNPDLCVLSDSNRISAQEYSSMLREKAPHVLVDVRPAVEMDICRLPHPALNIPFTTVCRNVAEAASKITKAVLEQSQSESGQSQSSRIPIVCVCRRGNDSQLVVDMLQKESVALGLNLVDIKGGLYSWAKHVDGDFPLY